MPASLLNPESPAENDTARLEAFSDGVFSIALTLLVLELKVPKPEPGAGPNSAWLSAALAAEWPSYLAFALSFLTILIMWVHHHHMFRFVHRATPLLLFVNGVFLLLITTVPYPTAVVAEYLTTPAARSAAAFYSGTFVLIALAFLALLTTATRKDTLARNADRHAIRLLRRSYFSGPPLYALATLAAFISPWASIAICIALWGLWALMPIITGKEP